VGWQWEIMVTERINDMGYECMGGYMGVWPICATTHKVWT